MTFKSGEIFAEHYQLINRLGAGSFGEVWLARNLMADINVAIKFYSGLDRNGINDFKEEFKLAYRLSHPNLLHMNHFDVYDQCPYLVMPYCSKGSAAQLRGNVSEKRVWEFIRDVSAGMAYLHAQNPAIIHQDIKLGNILIDENDRFIVTDFGISKKIEFHMQTLRSVKMESSGTIAYMSPERLKTPPLVVMASDIWSLGMSVYELVTGQVLWELGGLMQLGGADVPSLGSGYSLQLTQFFQRCLSVNPWERPKAQEAYEEAEAKLSGNVYHSRSVATSSTSVASSEYSLKHARSNQYQGATGQRISRSSSSSYRSGAYKKAEPTSWEKYGYIVKWGGGAILLFAFALGVFSWLLSGDEEPKIKEADFIQHPVVIDNPSSTDSISVDTPVVVPTVKPVLPKPFVNPKPKPKPLPTKPVVNKEEDLWQRCQTKNSVFMYNKYLNEYPKGKHVIEAKKRIRELENMPSREVIY